jgi:hypothetical protein
MATPGMARPQFKIGRDVALASAAGLGVGTVAAVVAYFSWMEAGGPTLLGVAVIPLSLIVVAVTHVLLARRRRARESDWVALGYTAAIVVAVALLAVEQALRGIYQELNVAVW